MPHIHEVINAFHTPTSLEALILSITPIRSSRYHLTTDSNGAATAPELQTILSAATNAHPGPTSPTPPASRRSGWVKPGEVRSAAATALFAMMDTSLVDRAEAHSPVQLLLQSSKLQHQNQFLLKLLRPEPQSNQVLSKMVVAQMKRQILWHILDKENLTK